MAAGAGAGARRAEEDEYALYEPGGEHDHEPEPEHEHGSAGFNETSGDGTTMEAEKRIRREIANSNERRRMQSINAGFQSLRTLLPRHEGEKLSKAAILQQTAEYIYSLEQEKTRLLSQNCQLKRLLNQHEGGEIPLKKRKTEIIAQAVSTIIPDSTEDTMGNTSSPEPISVSSPSVMDQKSAAAMAESNELRVQLERERRLRVLLEEQVRTLESQMYPESARDLSQHMTLHYEDAVEAESQDLDIKQDLEVTPTTVMINAASLPEVTVRDSPLLEAAIKAEPRVEVEVLPEMQHDTSSRLFLTSTSRQNLETIVEAIRHLEGDHLFQEEMGELPLALTKKPEPRLLQVEPFLQLGAGARHQQRPGVIVVKHS